MPIMAASPSEETQRRLSLVWGVDCLLVPNFYHTDEMLDATVDALRPVNLDPGDKIVITAGVPFGRKATTNLIQVHSIKSNGELGTIDESE
jgi:pyruvate kinase